MILHVVKPSGTGLAVTGTITPETMSLNLSERDSSAALTEDAGSPERSVGDWVRDPDGRVWRIRSVQMDPFNRTRTINLESVLQTLRDRIIPTEKKAADMGGGETCTAVQAIRHALSYQEDWRLGACDYSVSQPYSFSGDDLYSAIESVSETLEDCFWDLSFASYPFTISIRRLSWDPTCEMRMSRNITSLKRTVDRSKMYTRFYPVGADDLRIGAVERNVGLYGVKEYTETDSELDTEAKLRAWANRKLKKHAMPAVNISITGLDLSRATGEPMDRLRIGTICRVPLPEYGTSMAERITRLSWTDIIKEPEKVSVTMANELADVKTVRSMAEAVSAASATAAKRARAGGKKQKEDHAWMYDYEDHVGLIAVAVAGEGADKDWSRVSQIDVGPGGITMEVKKTKGDLEAASTKIEQNEKAIKLRAKKGEVATELSVECGNVKVSNGDLIVDGMVTADSVKTALAGINEAAMKNVSIVQAGITTLNCNNIRFTGNEGGYSTYTNIKDVFLSDVQVVSAGNNSYKLQYKRYSDSSWKDAGVTFSRAVSLRGAWNSGKTGQYTVTATNGIIQGTAPTTTIYGIVQGSSYRSGKNMVVSCGIYTQTVVGGQPRPDAEIKTQTITVDASEVWDAGAESGHTSPRYNCANNLTFLADESKQSSQPSTLGYMKNGSFVSLGSGYWYRRDGYMQTTTYYI